MIWDSFACAWATKDHYLEFHLSEYSGLECSLHLEMSLPFQHGYTSFCALLMTIISSFVLPHPWAHFTCSFSTVMASTSNSSMTAASGNIDLVSQLGGTCLVSQGASMTIFSINGWIEVVLKDFRYLSAAVPSPTPVHLQPSFQNLSRICCAVLYRLHLWKDALPDEFFFVQLTSQDRRWPFIHAYTIPHHEANVDGARTSLRLLFLQEPDHGHRIHR